MNGQDARDPFLGINEHIRNQARSQVPTYYTIGKILSVSPMVVRAAGMNLDKDDLRIAQHLKPGWVEHLAELEWALTADLPMKIKHSSVTLMSFFTSSATAPTVKVLAASP